MRKSRDKRKYMNHEGKEVYRYNAVWPVDIFRMVQEVANAHNRTIIMQLTVWVKEGYERWQREEEELRRKKLENSRLVNVFRDAPVVVSDSGDVGWVSPGEHVTR